MGNKNLFKALSCQTRMNILKKLVNKEIHLSELSRELKISKPVISRHIKILEEAELIKRRIIGNVHLLSANIKSIEQAFEPFIDEIEIKIGENGSILDALKQLPNIEIKKHGDKQFITSIDGEEGFYIYEVNGKTPKKSIEEYKTDKKITIQLKKIVPVSKKKIKIDIEKKKKK